MIKIEELQKGNLVLINQMICKVIESKEASVMCKIVSEFYPDNSDTKTREYFGESLTPIKLSKEWVKRSGFTIESESEEEEERIWGGGFNLHQSLWEESQGSDEFTFAIYIRGNGYLKAGYSVTTVHRLQNLYFGLRQKQIEFKLN